MTHLPRLLGLACLLAVFAVPHAAQAAKPNVILFIADDVNWNDYGCYGNKAARTPHIDALAKNGIRFTQTYLTASSCSPSRSSIITGRYPHNTGKAAELHQPISWNLPWFPAILRDAGYHTALSGKHHMRSTKAPAGETNQPEAFASVDGGRAKGNFGGHANWVKNVKQRPKDKPFFFWFAAYDAHRDWDGDNQWDASKYGLKHRPQDVVVPPFLSDDPQTRDDLASYYNEVTRFDHYIGAVVEELRTQGQLDNTLVLVMADNGRPFPRAKTRLHDSGMKTALVAHWPAGIKQPGVDCTSLVSVIDLAPTILTLAGAKTPPTMQGTPMQPLFEDVSNSIRRYAFSEHNWHDYEAHGRSIRADGFLYLRNNRPYFPLQGPADSVRSPSHRQLLALRDAKKLSPAQADVFLAPRPAEELYDLAADPHQLHNLAGATAHAEVQRKLRSLLARWSEETRDSVPSKISADSFHHETGDRIVKDESYRGTTPGEDRGASETNAPGPR